MLLFSHEVVDSFGLLTPCDPYQQCGFLYALYTSSSALDAPCRHESESSVTSSTSTLQWHSQGHIRWHFREEGVSSGPDVSNTESVNHKILVVISISHHVCPCSAQIIAGNLSKVFLQANISLNSNPKSSIVKQLKIDMLEAVSQAVQTSIFSRIQSHVPSDQIQTIIFGNPVQNSNTLSPNKSTHETMMERMLEEWNSLYEAAKIIPPIVNETISPPELTQSTSNGDSAERIKSDELLSSLPPIIPSSGGIFSSMKKLFFKNNNANGAVKSSSKAPARSELEFHEKDKINNTMMHKWHMFDLSDGGRDPTLIRLTPQACLRLNSIIEHCCRTLYRHIDTPIQTILTSQEHEVASTLTRTSLPDDGTIRILLTPPQTAQSVFDILECSDFSDEYNSVVLSKDPCTVKCIIEANERTLVGAGGSNDKVSLSENCTEESMHLLTFIELSGVRVGFLQRKGDDSTQAEAVSDTTYFFDQLHRDSPEGKALREYVSLSAHW